MAGWQFGLVALFLIVQAPSQATGIEPGTVHPDRDCRKIGTKRQCDVQTLYTTHHALVIQIDGDRSLPVLAPLMTDKIHYPWKWPDFAPATGWIGEGTGFLARDLNGDHIIERDELFGSMTQDGFAMLSRMDANHDGMLDASDPAFAGLVVWLDSNNDGRCQPNEVHTLAELRITSISLNSEPSKAEVAGNRIERTAPIYFANGQVGTIADVTFQVNWTFSSYLGREAASRAARTLPDMHGYGRVRNLRSAMSLNHGLLAAVRRLKSVAMNEPATYDAAVTETLFRWGGVAGMPPSARGPYIDARKLAFLEAYLGEYYSASDGGSDPATEADGALLDGIWLELVQGAAVRLLVQDNRSPMSSIFWVDQSDDAMTPKSSFAAVVHEIVLRAPRRPSAATAYWAKALSVLSNAVADYAPQADKIHPIVKQALMTAAPPYSSPQILEAASSGTMTYVVVLPANAALAEGRSVYGSKHSELFDVAAPDMTIVGGGGSDEVLVGAYSGALTFVEQQSGNDVSTLYFKPGVAPHDIAVTIGNSSDVVLNGKGMHIILAGMLKGRAYGIATINFADGTSWTRDDVIDLINKDRKHQ